MATAGDIVDITNEVDNLLIEEQDESLESLLSKLKLYDKNATNIKCPKSDCKSIGKNIKNMRDHIKRTHDPNKSGIICKVINSKGVICNKKCPDMSGFNRHQKTHSDIRIKCKYDGCDKLFAESSNIAHHENSCEFNPDMKEFSCETCGKKFITQTILNTHILIHNKIKKFNCNLGECGNYKDKIFFDTICEFNNHKDSTHSDLNITFLEFCTEDCSVVAPYINIDKYCNHLNRVHKIKTFKCPFKHNCKFRFYHEYDLKNHLDINHKKDEELKCDFYKCEFQTLYSIDFIKHYKELHKSNTLSIGIHE